MGSQDPESDVLDAGGGGKGNTNTFDVEDSDDDDLGLGTSAAISAIFANTHRSAMMMLMEEKRKKEEHKKSKSNNEGEETTDSHRRKKKKKSKKTKDNPTDSLSKRKEKSNKIGSGDGDEAHEHRGVGDSRTAGNTNSTATGSANGDLGRIPVIEIEDNPLQRNVTALANGNERAADVIDILDDDSVVEAAYQAPLEDDPGELLPFFVCFRGDTTVFTIYDTKLVESLRKDIATKFKITDPDSLQIFCANSLLLDNVIIKNSPITTGCTLEVFYTQKSDEQLYEENSSSVMCFKLQTADRRGRENLKIFVRKSALMNEVREKYAQKMSLDPESIRLMFDGNLVDLQATPEDNDLEDGDGIDVFPT